MKSKKAFLALLVVAVAVWSYNVLQIKGGISSKKTGEEQEWDDEGTNVSLKTENAGYKGNFRDPFEPYINVSANRPEGPRNAVARPREAEESVKLPVLTLNGVMWDPHKPRAVIGLPDGSTQLVTLGNTVAGATIKAIGRNSVTLSLGKKIWELK